MILIHLTIHRSAQEIGGNCIEVAADDCQRIILDVGRPLDAPEGAKELLPKSLDLKSPANGVLISHPHTDHYVLLHEVPIDGPIYSGVAAERLIRLTAGIHGRLPPLKFTSW